MQKLLNNPFVRAFLCLLLACGLFAGCTKEAKRARHMNRAEEFFKKGEYIKAEIEYRNALRLSKTLDPQLLARMGELYYAQGRARDAAPFLAEALKSKPDDLDLQYKLGTIYVTFRDFSNAQATALLILSNNPAHHEAKLLLADSAQKPEEIPVARQKIDELLKSSGESWSAHVALAQLAMREKNLDLAEKEIDLAARLAPTNSNVILSRAALAALRQQPQEAMKLVPSIAENAPARSPKRLLLIQSKMEGTNANLAEAKALADALLKEAPDYVPAWVLRGKIALAEKDYAECSRIARDVLAWDPNNYDIRLLNGRAMVLQGQGTNAIQEFQRAEKIDPQRPDARYDMAVAYVQTGAVDEALKKLDEALRLFPDYPDAIMLRARLRLQAGFPEEAVASLAPFVAKYPEATEASLLLAQAHSALNRWDDALAVYRGLIRRAPNVPEFWCSEGIILTQQKKMDAARSSFEQALHLRPDYIQAAEGIIDLDLARNDLDAARLRVEEQMALTTNSIGALMLQAKVAFAKRDWAVAESALTQVIKAQPNATLPYSMLASVYLMTREPQKALAQLRAAAEQNPKNAGAFLVTGVIYQGLKEYDKAKTAYEKALNVNPDLWAAQNNLAYLLSENLNQVDQALPFATKARQMAPADPSVADTLGWILYRQGAFSRALPLLRESAGKPEMAEQPEVQYHLAMALYTTGDESAAREAFERVIKLNKAFAEAKGVQRRLAVLDLQLSDPKAAETLEAALKEDATDFIAALKLGQVYEAIGANGKAQAALERAAKLMPTSVRPLLLLASLNAKLNDLPKALEAARAARKLAPNDAAMAGMLGRISYRANDFSAALALLQEYARSGQADVEAPYDLALSYYSAGQTNEARGHLQSYVARARGNRLAEARNLVTLMDFQAGKGSSSQSEVIAAARLQRDTNDIPGLFTLGLIAQQSGKYSDAAQKFEHIAELDKLFPFAPRHLALLYAEHLGNDQKAWEFGSKARQAFPSDAELAIALGKVSYRQNDFQNAARLLSDGVRQLQNDPEAFYYLGMAYHKLGKIPDARTSLNQALSGKLESNLAAEAQKVLASLK